MLTSLPLRLHEPAFIPFSARPLRPRPRTGTKDGATYNKYHGVCLETQSFPDGPNHASPSWPTGLLQPGEVYRHTTIYRFSAH